MRSSRLGCGGGPARPSRHAGTSTVRRSAAQRIAARVTTFLRLRSIARRPGETCGLAACVLVLVGCASSGAGVAVARAADDAALAAWAGQPDGFVIVESGQVSTAPDLDTALAAIARRGRPAHRYLYPFGAAGDVAHVLAYVPEAGLVAGRGLADALGVQIRRQHGGGTVVARGLRRAPVAPDGSVEVVVESLDGHTRQTVPCFVDPDFSGPLLVSRDLAALLGLPGFEVPGAATVQVALGRPFRTRRSLARATIPALDASGVVEVLVP